MKKEEMQNEIDSLLKELEAKNFVIEELKKEREGQDRCIEELRKEIQIRNEAIALLEEEKRSDAQPEEKKSGEMAVQDETSRLLNTLKAAAGIIYDSCIDHCPYGGDRNACANCSLNTRIQATGIYEYLGTERKEEN